MARPVPRRRAERDAPAADEYTSRRGRRAATEEPEEPTEERRPRRGRERGELPTRGGRRAAAAEPEEPTTSRRGRRREPEPPAEPELPSVEELNDLSDDDLFDLGVQLEVFESGDEVDLDDVYEDIEDALKSALEESRIDPDVPETRSRRGRRSEPEEPPARGRRGRAAAEEDEPSARGRGRGRRAAADENEPPARGRGRGRSSSRDEEDEEEGSGRVARRGFQGYKKAREATSSFADDFKLTDEEVLVKFLPTIADEEHVKEAKKNGERLEIGDLIDAEPFATYGEHGLYKELNEGQRVWPCLAPEEDCPVCNTGHNARAVALWNIVVIPEDGAPQLKVLKAGPKLEKLLEKKSALKTGPLDKEYYSLSQTAGKNDGPVEYTVELVRERDLSDPDGWDTTPFTEAELDEFIDKAYDNTFVKFPSQRDMKDVARKLRNSD